MVWGGRVPQMSLQKSLSSEMEIGCCDKSEGALENFLPVKMIPESLLAHKFSVHEIE